MNKRDFQKMEREFCSLFGVKVDKEHSVLNTYDVNTVNGEYSVWFDKRRPYGIFGRFKEPSAVVKKIPYVNINPYSGKMNFLGDNSMKGFMWVMKNIKA